MLSKVIAWSETRERAIARLERALSDYVIFGVATNIPWLRAALVHPAFRSGDYDTGFCARHAAELLPRPDPQYEEVALVAAAVAAYKRDHDRAEAFAARAGQARGQSAWARLGRLRALRGGSLR
jgi:acetyl-CoA carboxylase biotin carboxylase subunit